MDQCLKARDAMQKDQCTSGGLAWSKLQSKAQVLQLRLNLEWARGTLCQDLLYNGYKIGCLHRSGQGCLGVS